MDEQFKHYDMSVRVRLVRETEAETTMSPSQLASSTLANAEADFADTVYAIDHCQVAVSDGERVYAASSDVRYEPPGPSF